MLKSWSFYKIPALLCVVRKLKLTGTTMIGLYFLLNYLYCKYVIIIEGRKLTSFKSNSSKLSTRGAAGLPTLM